MMLPRILQFPVLLAAVTLGPWAEARQVPPEIAGELQKLQDRDFQVREEAMLDLSQMGAELLPWLNGPDRQQDPELNARLSYLERRLVTGVNQDSPEELREAVDRFASLSDGAKKRELTRLMRQGHWQAVFGLYLLERELNERAEYLYQALARQALRNLVRQLVLDGQTDEAEYFLRKGAESRFGMDLYAAYLAPLDEVPQDLSPEVRFHLALERGEWESAEVLASKLGMEDETTRLKLLRGNPGPWLKMQALKQRGSEASKWMARWLDAENAGAEGVLDEWRQALAEEALKVMQEPEQGREAEARALCLSLAAIGETELSRKLFDQVDRGLSAADYYRYREMPEQYFAQLGVDDASEAGFIRWFEENPFFTKKQAYSIERNSAVILHFLLERGGREWVDKILERAMAGAGPEDRWEMEDLIIDQLGGELFNQSQRDDMYHSLLYDYACKALTRPDAPELVRLAERLLEPDSQVARAARRIDALVGRSFNRLPPEERLKRILSVMGYSLVSETQRLKWLERVMDQARQDGADEAAHLAGVLDRIGDLASLWQFYQKRPQDLPQELRAGVLRYLVMQSEWKALERLDFKASEIDFDYIQQMRLQAVMSQDPEESKALERKARQLLMGDLSERDNYLVDLYVQQRDEEMSQVLFAVVARGKRLSLNFLSPGIEGQLVERLLRQHEWSRAAAFCQFWLVEELQSRALRSPNFSQSLMRIENIRHQLLFARGMQAWERGQKKRAMELLEEAVVAGGAGTVVADVLFPVLADFPEFATAADQWYQTVDQIFIKALKHFPNCAQTLNGRAWVAARATRNLDMAAASVHKALQIEPRSGAIMDTRAEVTFAKGRRQEAIADSQLAARLMPLDPTLPRQQKHFQDDPQPKARP